MTRATCSGFGSAQQYHGSFRYGTVARSRAGRRVRRGAPGALVRQRRISSNSCAPVGRRVVLPTTRCTSAAERRRAGRDAPSGTSACRDRRRPRCAPHLLELEQPRTFGNEQPDRQLNRRDVIDQIELGDRVEQIAVILERQPRMKRDERRHQRQAASRHSVAPPRRSPARVCPLSSNRSTRSSIDSTALVTNAQPVSARRGSRSRCWSRCSTLIVTS